MRNSIITLAACLSAAACGGGSGSGTTVGTAADAAAFCTGYYANLVNFQVTCDHADRDAFNKAFMVDCTGGSKEVTSGRIRFDTSKSAGCLAAIQGASCTSRLNVSELSQFPACSGLVNGTVAVGGNCYNSDECNNGHCNSTPSTCPGTCQALLKVGDNCSANANLCPAESFCNNNICTNTVGLGATCGNPGNGCGNELNCVSGTCQARPTSGPCDQSTVYCALGYACANGTTCSAKVATGGDCTVGPEVCGAGDYCNSAHKCVEGGVIGGACEPQDNGSSCLTGYCNSSNVCAARLTDGSACTSFNECASFNCNSSMVCAAAVHTCAAP